MFIEVIILTIIIGYLFKGSLKNFKDADLLHIELIFIGFIIETAVVLLIRKGVFIDTTIRYLLHLSMYILLMIFVYLNRKHISVMIMGAGFLLNAIAIFCNGGVMPVSSWAMEKAHMSSSIASISKQGLYRLVDDKTVFTFFCDVIPHPYPRAFVISAGDILIAVGLFLLILKLMRCRIKRGKEA